MKKLILLLALAVSLIFAPAAGANLILNGNFEEGTQVSPFITVFAGGTQYITDWTVTAGSVDYIDGYWTPPAGSLSIDMTGTPGNGTMASTSFNTVIGGHYMVSFDMSGNFVQDAYLGSNRSMEVEAAGTSAIYTFNWFPLWSTTNMGWVTEYFPFTASSTSTTLTFISLSTNDVCGPALANVYAAVPLPPTVLLLGSGLVGLGLLGRRKIFKA